MNKKIILPLALVMMLTLTACGTTDDNTENTNTNQETNSIPQTSSADTQTDIEQETDKDNQQTNISKGTVVDGVNYRDIEVTPENAFNKFIEYHEGSEITEMKLDTKYNDLEYKIEGYDDNNEYQLRMNAVSGEIKSDETKNLDKGDKSDGVISKDEIGSVNDIVEKSIKNSDDNLKFKKWSLEDDDGKLAFEIEFKDSGGKDVEYTYDLETGDLVKKGD